MKKCSTVIACKRNRFDFWNSCKRLQNFVNVEALALTQENLSSGFANSKGADQPVHPDRLISAFVIRFLERIISNLLQAKFQFSS